MRFCCIHLREIYKVLFCVMGLKMIPLTLLPHLPETNEFKSMYCKYAWLICEKNVIYEMRGWHQWAYHPAAIAGGSILLPYHTVKCLQLTLIARFMGPTWGPSGAERTQVGPMQAPWTLLSELYEVWTLVDEIYRCHIFKWVTVVSFKDRAPG